MQCTYPSYEKLRAFHCEMQKRSMNQFLVTTLFIRLLRFRQSVSLVLTMYPVNLDSYITRYLFARGSLIALMMEAVRISETSVNFYLTTRQYIPEDSKLHVPPYIVHSEIALLRLVTEAKALYIRWTGKLRFNFLWPE
jgi:hypothetical protein